jgi:hypothetical protein
MKNSSFFGVLMGILIFLLIISCGGSPAPAETPPPVPARPAPTQPAAPVPAQPVPQVEAPGPEAPDQAALDRLNASRVGAESSRQQALDIESPGYFPEEWDAAEGQYASAKADENETTLEDVEKAIDRYNASAKAYEDLARQSLSLYYQDRADEIVQARNKAIEAGIEDLSPDRLEAVDTYIDQAIERYEAGEPVENYYAAAIAAFEALDRYRALSLGAGAYLLREEIQKRGFTKYDPGNFERADVFIDWAVDAYDRGDTENAEINAEEAYLRYSLVLSAGWKGSTAELRSTAEAERKRALDAKADVAVRKEFGDAETVYTRALTALGAKDYAEASESYALSAPLFVQARKTAEYKRKIARNALDIAEKKILQSDETAREAEVILQGGAE